MLPIRVWASLPQRRAVLALALLLTAWPAVKAAPLPADPVEAFRQALQMDRSPNPSPEAIALRRKNLDRAIESLRTLGQMSRVLLLTEWGNTDLGDPEADLDNQAREKVMAKLENGLKAVLARGSANDRIAAANLVSFTVGAARRQDTEGTGEGDRRRKTGGTFHFLRERMRGLSGDLERVAEDSTPEVRAAAARALGSIEADPKRTIAVLQRLLAAPDVIVRRAAAQALAIMMEAADPFAFDTLSTPVRSGSLVIPAACSALNDPDVEVRRHAIAACHTASAAVVKAVPPVPTEPPLPPKSRKLTSREVERVFGERARLDRVVEVLTPVFEAYRANTAALTRAAADEDPTVRINVRRVLEDLGEANQKLQRLRDAVTYPDLPEKLPENPDKGDRGALPLPSPAAAQSADASAPTGPVEAFSPLPNAPVVRDDPPSLDAPQPLTPEDIPAPAGQLVQARPAAFVKPGDDKLPPPRPVGNGNPATATLNRALFAVVDGLSDPQVRVRLASVDVLEMMGESAIPAIPALVGALRDPNLFVRWAAARTLGKLAPHGADQAVPALARLLPRPEDYSVRLAATNALALYGPAARAAVPALGDAVGKGDIEARVAAMKALEAIGTDAAPALPAIAWGLKDSSTQVRAESARVLGRFGPLAARALPALRKAMTDPAEDVRRAASDAILAIDVKP
jgi:HEAT repeat protein